MFHGKRDKKRLNGAKGYGFIARETGEDVFVHFKEIIGEGYKSLNEGDQVGFEVTTGPKGFFRRRRHKAVALSGPLQVIFSPGQRKLAGAFYWRDAHHCRAY